ncbi:MAG: hypothetical protein AB7O32_00085 [Vicinamibacterales bacterium]
MTQGIGDILSAAMLEVQKQQNARAAQGLAPAVGVVLDARTWEALVCNAWEFLSDDGMGGNGPDGGKLRVQDPSLTFFSGLAVRVRTEARGPTLVGSSCRLPPSNYGEE